MAGVSKLGPALLGGGLAAVASTTETGRSVVAYCVVVPAVFLVPGFLLTRRLLPRRRFDFEAAMTTIGAGIALAIVLGLVLHPFGALTTRGWIVALGVTSLLAVMLPRRAAQRDGAPEPTPFPTLAVAPRTAAIAAVVVLLAAGGIAEARLGAVAHRQFAYTELWMLPLPASGLSAVTIGVRNREQRTADYELEIRAGERTVARWPRFTLADDAERVERVAVPAGIDPTERLEARLRRAEDPTLLYRRVWISAARQDAGR